MPALFAHFHPTGQHYLVRLTCHLDSAEWAQRPRDNRSERRGGPRPGPEVTQLGAMLCHRHPQPAQPPAPSQDMERRPGRHGPRAEGPESGSGRKMLCDLAPFGVARRADASSSCFASGRIGRRALNKSAERGCAPSGFQRSYF